MSMAYYDTHEESSELDKVYQDLAKAHWEKGVMVGALQQIAYDYPAPSTLAQIALRLVGCKS